MPGPSPKPPHQRRRPNVGRGVTLLPPDERPGPIPALPGSRTLLPATPRWWPPYSISDENNGINARMRASHRQNYVIPPRRNRSFPLVELLR